METAQNFKFTHASIDHVYETLISTDEQLKEFFNNYIQHAYAGIEEDRLHTVDIGEISSYIIAKLKVNETDKFQLFFDAVEDILSDCDAAIENLIIVGLLEGIQNIAGREINYHTGFDKWLKPLSKVRWDNLIYFWEGKKWRNIEI